jgi:hypothetical protein
MGYIYATYKLNEEQVENERNRRAKGKKRIFNQEEYEVRIDEETRDIEVRIGDGWFDDVREMPKEWKKKHLEEVLWVGMSSIKFVPEFQPIISRPFTPEERAAYEAEMDAISVPEEWYETHDDDFLVFAPEPKS